MRIKISILYLLVCPVLLGQNTFDIKVVDAESGQPISNVSIQHVSGGKIFYTGVGGQITVTIPSQSSRVVIRHLAYKGQTVGLTAGKKNEIRLEPSSVQLPTAEVSDNLPDTVFGSAEYHVADFCFGPMGMYLLTYEKEQRWKKENQTDLTLYKGCRLILLGLSGQEEANIKVPDDAIGFYEDFPGDLFLQFRQGIFAIQWQNQNMGLSLVDPELFAEWIEPVIDTVGHFICFSDFQPTYPAFEYSVLDTRDTTMHHLRGIADKELMEQFRSEFKWLPTRAKLDAYKLERQTGMDKEIIAAYMTGFPESIYFESLYAPLFVRNDTVLIFDHYSEKLYFHQGIQTVDSLQLVHHKGRNNELKWEKKLIMDEVSGEVYALYSKGKDGFIMRVDLKSGEPCDRIKLHHPYPENIKVHGGEAFFIYRPFGSLQKRFLYKQML